MLYEVSLHVEGSRNKYAERVIEAAEYGPKGQHLNHLTLWANKWAEEQSVVWGFKTVQVVVSRIFPMEIDEAGVVTSQVNSILCSWETKVDPVAHKAMEGATPDYSRAVTL